MLVLQAAGTPPRRKKKPAIGIAIAGGGPIGGMYELGALRALDEAIAGLDMTALDVYVGVSSGAFIAASLANGLDTTEMCRIFLTGDSHMARFRPDVFIQPAFLEYLRRAAHVPRMLFDWFTAIARHPLDIRISDALLHLGSLLPTGLFDNDAVEAFLRGVFERPGHSNDFRTLKRKLYVIAVELDSGRRVRFGASGYDDVPISRAIEASAALPGLYPPVRIKDRYYVDGALQRTLHASVALDEGADLVIGLNPLVPFDAQGAYLHGKQAPESLIEGGLPAVLSQTFRTLLRSRMQASLSKYAQQYPAADLVLFEPDPGNAELFFTNVFSYANRVHIAELAYHATLADLHAQRAQLAPVLERHGLALREAVIADRRRRLVDGLEEHASVTTASTARLRHALDELGELVRRRTPRDGRPARRPRRRAP